MAEKVKLDSGREVQIKEVGLDMRDELMDGLAFSEDSDGNKMMVNMHSTLTKWLRAGLNGKAEDVEKTILGLSLDDKTQVYLEMHKMFTVGEGSASSSKQAYSRNGVGAVNIIYFRMKRKYRFL